MMNTLNKSGTKKKIAPILGVILLVSCFGVGCGSNTANFGGNYSGTIVSAGVTENATLSLSQNSDDVDGSGNMTPQPTPSASPNVYIFTAFTSDNSLNSVSFNSINYDGSLSLNNNLLTGTITTSQGTGPSSLTFNLTKQ